MPQQLTYMAGIEFMTKIVIVGERNFAGIRLEEGFDLSGDEDYKALQKYLKSKSTKDLKQNPYILSGSSLRGLRAEKLPILYLEAQNADLTGANLQKACFMYSNFTNASFAAANLIEASLSNSNYRGASFKGANLMKAFLEYTNLQHCDFQAAYLQGTWLREADLRGTRNLAEALSFEEAHLYNTKIYPQDALKIIDKTKFFKSEVLQSN